MITLITPTGARPEAWELCKRWMRGQTYNGPVRWIVVDDGQTPQNMSGTPEGWEVIVVYTLPAWTPGSRNTQVQNLLAARHHVPKDSPVVIIEDDDYYYPEWLDTVSHMLLRAELVGQAGIAYFNVSNMACRRQGDQQGHSALCSTAMRGEALEVFWEVVEDGSSSIDVSLWHRFLGNKYLRGDTDLVVGIKGLPGRPGIGVGHRMAAGVADVATLRKLVGNDVEHYIPFLQVAE